MTKSIRILIVEDNPADIDLITDILAARDDVEISSAKDGVEALQRLNEDGAWHEAGRPTLILLDLNLPRKDGRHVLAVLKGDDVLRKIPVVILSSSESDIDIIGCYHLGANSYLTKPVTLADYRATVRSIETFWLGSAKLPRREGHSVATRIGDIV